MPNRPRNHDRKIEEAAKKRHERLVEQWRNIRRLYLAGADLRHIYEGCHNGKKLYREVREQGYRKQRGDLPCFTA